jgi:hypothetical protein
MYILNMLVQYYVSQLVILSFTQFSKTVIYFNMILLQTVLGVLRCY